MGESKNIVVIGSGLGGLVCGAILSREGYRVTVLEKNKQIGGNLQIFSRDKRIFDTGIHYIGGLGEGENLYRYFQYIGIMEDLKLQKLDEDCFDIVSFEGDERQYCYGQGYDNFIRILTEYFPEEESSIKRYCDKLKEVCDSFPMYNLERSDGELQHLPYLSISAREFIASCTQNEKLRKVLAGTNVLYAGEGDKTPLYVHALVINSYIESSWRCKNGGSQIAILLSRIIRQHGGKVLRRAEVDRFIFNENKIVAANLTDGRSIEGDLFISNIHPVLTFDMLEANRLRKSYRKRILGLENSISVFIIYLVLKQNRIPYFNHNYYHHITDDVWEGASESVHNWPSGYAVFTGATEGNSAYADAMTVMAYMPYDEVKIWEDTFNTVTQESARGEAYERFKAEKAEILMDHLESKFPNIREHIDSYYTSTPLTYRDYIGTKDGSLYGIVKDYRNPMKSYISPKTKVPNLFLTGQNLNMHGVLGVTIGAVSTCSEILGHDYLMNKIINETTHA